MTNRSATLDDLILLNFEIAALVKAGVPLELGLRGLFSTKSRLARLSNRLADRLASGLTLPNALAEEGPSISPVYTSVIEAGLATGRLPEVLESLAASGQIIQETRRRMFLAMLYPMICLAVAYAGFCFYISVVAPAILHSVDDLPNMWAVNFLRFLHHYRGYFLLVVPATVLGLFVVVGLLRGMGIAHSIRFLRSFRWFMGRSLDWAQFTELLALQVEQNAPLAHAIVLAANSTDNIRWEQQARKVSEQLKNGASLQVALRAAPIFPPLVQWMLASSEKQGTLAITLRQLSDMYRRRALRRAAIVKVWLPVTMTMVFTSVIGLTYGLAFFLPLRAFLDRLSQE